MGADATLTVLAVGALPATLALAAVTPIVQDTGALVHAWAGFAEVNWLLGFCKGGHVSRPSLGRPCGPYAHPGQR